MAKSSGRPVVQLPFYARAALILTGLFVLISMLALAKSIIVPLLFSIVLSIILSTIVDYLESKKVDRVLAIWITLFFSALVVVIIAMGILSQFNSFLDRLPEMNDKFDVLQE